MKQVKLIRISFILVVIIKVLTLGFFTSDYSTLLFQPFLKVFVRGELNPWQYYFENGLSNDAFPYHALMLALHSVPALINEVFEFQGFLKNLIFKLPLLFSDLLLFYSMLKLFPNSKKEVLYFYFFSPIIYYSIYIHSQLDIVPTALLVFSFWALISERNLLSSLILGFALATKFHVLVVIPLIVLFVYRKHSLKKALFYLVIPIFVLFVIDLPFISSEGFLQMVVLNPKQAVIFDTYYNVQSLHVLLPILAILLVYFHFFYQKKVNKDLLNFYIAALYILIIVFIYPAPAWYVWLVPFITIYFIHFKEDKGTVLLYFTFCLVYLIFFIFLHKGEYNEILFLDRAVDTKIYNDTVTNTVYTILEGILLIILFLLYKYGMSSNSIYKRKNNLTIGIGGDSGVGKSTFLSNLALLFGDKLLKLEGDGEHKWERGNENWSRYTHLDPKANNIHLQAQAIYNLKNDRVINRSEYDHASGNFTELQKVFPRDIIAISGLHPFYLPKLRKIIDLKIYLDTEEKLRRHWKIVRDTKHRGYSLDKIMAQIEARVEDSEKYIHSQKNFADMTINIFTEDDFDLGSDNVDIKLCLKVTLDASLHLDTIIDNLNCPLIWDYNEDLSTQYLILKDEPKIDFKNLADKLILNVMEVLNNEPVFLKGYDGLLQFLTLLLISEKLKEDR